MKKKWILLTALVGCLALASCNMGKNSNKKGKSCICGCEEACACEVGCVCACNDE